MLRLLTAILTVAVLLFASGCSTLGDAQAAKGTGASRTYSKSFEVVWSAMVDTVNISDLVLVAENKDKGTMLAQATVSAFSWGENVAIYVDGGTGKAGTRVEVITKAAVATNVTSIDWSARLLGALDRRLK
jgi:hypothetical protein